MRPNVRTPFGVGAAHRAGDGVSGHAAVAVTEAGGVHDVDFPSEQVLQFGLKPGQVEQRCPGLELDQEVVVADQQRTELRIRSLEI